MGVISNFFGRNEPKAAPEVDEAAREKALRAFDEQIRKMTTLEQINKALARLNRYTQHITAEHLEIVERRLEELAGEMQDAAHIKTVNQSRKRLEALRRQIGIEGEEEQRARFDGSDAAMMGAGLGAVILGWFGIKAVRRHGILGSAGQTARGAMGLTRLGGRTGIGAINFGIKHPIMAGFLGAAGVGAGVQLTEQMREYFKRNSDALIREMEAIARETGRNPEEVARERGHRLADYIRSAGSSTVDTAVKGIVYVFRGKIDPETGAVILPHSTMRPAFFVAYQAGVRGRAWSSETWRNWQWLTPFRPGDQTRMGHFETVGNMAGDRARQIEAAYKEINMLPKNDPRRIALEKQLGTAINLQTGQRLDHIAQQAGEFHRQNQTTFTDFNKSIQADMNVLEQKVREGKAPPGMTVEEFKRAELKKINDRITVYHEKIGKAKIDLGNQFTETWNRQAKSRLNMAGGGYIDSARRKMESIGYSFATTRGVNLVTKAAVAYSTLPFFMEFASASMNSLEGNPKLKRLQAKKENGLHMTEAEEKEMKRLENQWKAVGLDATQMVGGFVPVVGEAIDFYTAFTGKDLNGRDLSTASRVTAGVMGTLGTASLVLAPFTGGISVVGFRGLRGAGTATKALKTAATVEKRIEALHQSTKVIDLAKKAGTLSTINKAALATRNGIQVARAGMQVVSYGMLGVHLYHGAVDFVQHSAEKIAGVRERAAEFAESVGQNPASVVPERFRPKGEGDSVIDQFIPKNLPKGFAPKESGSGEGS